MSEEWTRDSLFGSWKIEVCTYKGGHWIESCAQSFYDNAEDAKAGVIRLNKRNNGMVYRFRYE